MHQLHFHVIEMGGAREVKNGAKKRATIQQTNMNESARRKSRNHINMIPEIVMKLTANMKANMKEKSLPHANRRC
jgi:hypothetical protein